MRPRQNTLPYDDKIKNAPGARSPSRMPVPQAQAPRPVAPKKGDGHSANNAQASSDKFVYDPLDARPGELDLEEVPNYLTSQRDALNLNGNGVIYHSEPFAEDTEVTGYLKFIAWISMDVPDTDFAVSVYEIKRDGTSVSLTSDAMRARYRESRTEEKLVKPGEINRYEFNSFTFFSRRIAKGSRLRLILSCPNTIQLEKNYNSGKVVAEESGKDARTAHVTLYHDTSHPSSLEIPVVK